MKMRKFAKTAVLVVIGLVILVFALANRQVVIFSLDPLGSLDPASPFVFQMPLFALAVALVMIGVLIGGIATWVRQGKWRRRARQTENAVLALRAENEKLRRDAEMTMAPQLAPPSGANLAHSD